MDDIRHIGAALDDLVDDHLSLIHLLTSDITDDIDLCLDGRFRTHLTALVHIRLIEIEVMIVRPRSSRDWGKTDATDRGEHLGEAVSLLLDDPPELLIC